MKSNINLYKFIFYKTCSVNKQHNYTHDGYKKQILLYNKKRYNTLINAHTILLFNAWQRRNKNNTNRNSKFEWNFLYPVKTFLLFEPIGRLKLNTDGRTKQTLSINLLRSVE